MNKNITHGNDHVALKKSTCRCFTMRTTHALLQALLRLTVDLEQAEDLGAGDGADLSDTVRVTQDDADLERKHGAWVIGEGGCKR